MTVEKNRPIVCCFPLRLRENAVLELLYKPIRNSVVLLKPYDWWRSSFTHCDIFDVHWPDAVVMGNSGPKVVIKLIAFVLSVMTFKLRGVKIVYHVHNIGSHEGNFPRIERFLWAFFLPRVDVFVHMNTASIAQMKRQWQQVAAQRHEMILLPHYRETLLAPSGTRAEIRERYGLAPASHVLLCFGLLRPYKGLETLIQSFLDMQQEPDLAVELVIAGRPSDAGYSEALKALSGGNGRITLIMRFVSEAELSDLLHACDTVVMAHRKVNNSGVAMMALSASRRLIAPALGALPEMAEIAGRDWVTLYDGLNPKVLADAVARPAIEPRGEPDLSRFEPMVVAEQLTQLYVELSGHLPMAQGAPP